MPKRTQAEYQALYRDFERIDYFIDTTSADLEKRDFGYNQEKYAKAVWDAFNKRKEVFNNCVQRKCFETCEAYGFLKVFPLARGNTQKLLKEAKDYKNFGIIKPNSIRFKVHGNSKLSFMNYSLENMKEYLGRLAEGKKIKPRYKSALDAFLDKCAVTGECIIYALEESQDVNSLDKGEENIAAKKQSLPSFS